MNFQKWELFSGSPGTTTTSTTTNYYCYYYCYCYCYCYYYYNMGGVLLCYFWNVLQPHFDYACTSWYPGLNKRLSKKIQTAHLGVTEFKAINWLPTKNRIDQCVCVNIMKFSKELLRRPVVRYSIHATTCTLHLK